MKCPYCGRTIGKDLVGSNARLQCPQCGRALRVTRRFYMPVTALLGVVLFLVWAWMTQARGIRFGGSDIIVMVAIATVVVSLVRPLLPRELRRTREQSEQVTTLDIDKSDEV